MAQFVTNHAKTLWARGDVPWLAATGQLKCMLLDTALSGIGGGITPDDDFAAAVAVAEVTGTGYAPGYAGGGRRALVLLDPLTDDPNDKAVLKATNPTWTAVDGFTVAACAFYVHATVGGITVTGDADAPLLYVADLAAPKVMNGGDFELEGEAPAGGDSEWIDFKEPV